MLTIADSAPGSLHAVKKGHAAQAVCCGSLFEDQAIRVVPTPTLDYRRP